MQNASQDLRTTSPVFAYHHEPAGRWASSLEELKGRGAKEIILPVSWAAHEAIQGIRDFSRGSRLRIEKVLALCQDLGLGVRVQTGFGNWEDSLPTWARGEWEIPAMVPASALHGRAMGMRTVTLASLFDDKFRDLYFSFLDELFAILGLYVAPEGPVLSVRLDFGPLEQDQNLGSSLYFQHVLAHRYPNVEQLNLRYRSVFRNLESATTTQGYRVLVDKRPWHASFDYQWCRQHLLAHWWSEVCNLPHAAPIQNFLEAGVFSERPKRKGHSYWSIAFEGCLLEEAGDQAFPVSPYGLLHGQAVTTARLWEYLEYEARDAGVAMHRLAALGGTHDADECLETPVVVFVCGKFIPKSWASAIQNWIKGGGHAVFPFGLPLFDENLQAIVWHPSLAGKQETEKAEPNSIRKCTSGKGTLWMKGQPLDLSPSTWIELETLMEHLKANAFPPEITEMAESFKPKSGENTSCESTPSSH